MTNIGRPPIPALLYHAIGIAPAGADAEARALFVHPDRFAWQMRSLYERGFRTVSLQEYAAAIEGRTSRPQTVLLTFDDAYAHLDEMATPILRRYHFTAALFAPWQHLGGRNTWDAEEHPHLSALEVATSRQLKAMDAGPWEVASHGMCHVDLRKISSSERRAQLAEARDKLSELLGRPVRELAYPYGDQDHGVKSDARTSGYRLAFVARTGRCVDSLQMPRRPISGNDGRLLFRLKTSPISEQLYGARRLIRKVNRDNARALPAREVAS